MSELSEEQIINSINPIVNARKTHKDDNLYSLQLNAYQLDIIQGLLDLYQKEKEKNKELNKLKGFEMLDIFNMGKESSRQRIKHDWVEKDKIREKLKEEQERLKAGFGKMYEENLGNSATRILQDLLE